MARRPLRGVAAVLIWFAIAGCSGTQTATANPDPATTTPPKVTTTSTTLATTTTADTTTTSTTPGDTEPSEPAVDALIGMPDGEGPFPSVVVVHGGGWVTGSVSIMEPLTDYLNANGYLTVNTSYTLATLEDPSFPEAIDDVACAVRYAADRPDSDGSVALIGFSSGAHIGSLVALTGDEYGEGCGYPGTGIPDRFVGLAGPYDVTRLGLVAVPFFGVSQRLDPDLWALGNPLEHTEENPDLDSLIMYGDRDGLVIDDFAFQFAAALEDAGSEVLLERVEGASHNDMHDPALVGDLIVTWLDR